MDPADQLEDVAWYKNIRYVCTRTHSIHDLVILARIMTKRSADAAFGRDDTSPSSRPISVPNAPRMRPLETPALDIPFLDIGPTACSEHYAVREGELQKSPSVLLLKQWMREERP